MPAGDEHAAREWGGPSTASKPEEPGTQNPPIEVKKEEPVKETEIAGSLATPTEAYKTAYELRKKKDVAGLKGVISKDMTEFLAMMGEAENKSLDQMLRDLVEKPQADRAESRAEKIDGNWATLEYLSETGTWKTMYFEKVDGKWLLSLPKADKLDIQEAEK